jgi:hypothetical protein
MANNLKGYDAFQVLRSVFDVDMNCLRVCIVDGANPGSSGVIVTISHLDDSIRLGDGTNFFTSTSGGGKVALDVSLLSNEVIITDGVDNLEINSDGSINVKDSGIAKNTYNEVLSVPSGSLTNITTFTAIQDSRLKQIDVSGENIATYEVLVNGNIVSKKRTYFGTSLDHTFFFDKGINFTAGQQVLVRVIHNRPTTANFNANIIVIEE